MSSSLRNGDKRTGIVPVEVVPWSSGMDHSWELVQKKRNDHCDIAWQQQALRFKTTRMVDTTVLISLPHGLREIHGQISVKLLTHEKVFVVAATGKGGIYSKSSVFDGKDHFEIRRRHSSSVLPRARERSDEIWSVVVALKWHAFLFSSFCSGTTDHLSADPTSS